MASSNEGHLEFSYRLAGSGWADARIADGDRWAAMPASYLSDTLGELLLALSQLQDGDETATTSWEEEPGEYRWLFRRTANRVSLRILEFSDSYPPQPEERGIEVFATERPLDEFATVITAGLRAVLEEWGEDGYKQKWIEHPFPTELLELVESRIAQP